MLSFTVAYPYAADKKFDMDYYLNKHLPIITDTPGTKVYGIFVEQGLAGAVPDTPPAFFCVAHLHFESITDLMDTLAAVGDISSDFPNYTNVIPMMQIAEVKRPQRD